MMNTEHAPTPWTVLPYQYVLNEPQRGRIHGPNNEPIVDDANPTFADATFIVRAVNSHAAMLAALEWALCHVRFSGGPEGDAETFSANYNAAQSAIAQAKGEK